MRKIGFIGVGKLGQPCAEIMAEKHDVVGYDICKRNPKNFKMVTEISDLVLGRDIIFIAVETSHLKEYGGSEPSSHLPNRDFDYTAVQNVLSGIDNHLNKNQLVVLISTVLPGTLRQILKKKINNAELIYNPYLIAMGTTKWDMTNPEMIMIGTEDGSHNSKVDYLIDFYKSIMENDPRYVIGTWEECECTKLFYNTFISTKLSLVNMIQDVAEKLGNINSETVCKALAESDRRIMGKAYMTPGMGDGGGCHPRDNIALRFLAEKLDLGYDLFGAVMTSREVQASNMAKKLIELSNKNLPIVIVGKAYKPLVSYEEGSSSILVGHYVNKMGGKLFYLDEMTKDYPPKNLGPAVYLLAHNQKVTYGHQLDTLENWHDKKKIIREEDNILTAKNKTINLETPFGTKLKFSKGSIIIDPWKKTPPIEGIRVIHYGNTRKA
jgi:UDPglucose 6-dehydrogenase